jgi:predicted GNAT family N-acyltransferase
VNDTLACRLVDSQADFDRCVEIRLEVFVSEQGVPVEEELDDLDATASHVLAWLDGQPVGTGRIVFEAEQARVGRMAVRAPYRGRGIGSALLRTLLERARASGIPSVYLAAQVHALGFYQRFGFAVYGEPFLDGGIPHRWMRLPLA